MTPPLLKLAFVQGPKDGESFEYKPGSTIRIGRYVRGNEITIKDDAGISSKHLRIVSDSENWIIHDLGSSNGTILNEKSLDQDTPVTLRHGDVIKLGEYTSIVVSFESDVQVDEEEEEERKLPPRPRRNNRRLPVPDPDPVQEKPTRRGRPRATRSKVAAVAKEEEEAVVEVEKKGNSRAPRGGKKNTEAAEVEKKGNSRAPRGGKKNAENVQSLGLNSIKLEVEDTPKGVGVEVSAMKRATRSSRQIGEDSFMDLDMVLSQARAKKKNVEQKSVVGEMEDRNEDVEEEDKENEKDVGDEKARSETSDKEEEASKRVETESRKSTSGEEDVEEDKENEMDVRETSDKDDETSKRVEQVEMESGKSALGEENLNSSVKEDGEAEKLQDAIETSDGGCNKEEKSKQESTRNEKNVEKIDLEKMTLGDWFKYMEVYLRKQIMDETEKLIAPLENKALRVQQYIAEHKQAKGKGKEM